MELTLDYPYGGQFDRFLTALSHLTAMPKNKIHR
jgi:hypothetical protein